MSFCHNKLTKVPGVMILYCTSGIGQLQINFKEYTLIENTLVPIIVTSTIMRLQASNDFKVTFILFPHDIMVELGTQIDHQLIVFIKHNPVYTHTSESSMMTKRMIDSMIDIYKDKRNRFREQMMKNQLQNFFLDFYDKAAPYLHKDEYLISSRQEELFRRFISQLQSDITREREVRY